MKNLLKYILLLPLIFISCNDQKTGISGQVFVVTNGAQSIPLGLVSIGFTDSEIFGLALDSSLSVYDQSILEIENSITLKKNEIEGENVLKNDLWNDVLKEANTKSLSSFAVPGKPYALIDAKPEFNFFKNWIASSESERVLDLRVNSVEYYRKRFKLNSLTNFYSQILKIDSQLKELDELENSLLEIMIDNSIITDLSKKFQKTKTNAQGEFFIDAKKGDHVIFASSSRMVGNEVEKYMWCLMISPKEEIKDLFLSNDNLIKINDLREISRKLNKTQY
jgi:hypothetical protein